MENLSRRGKGDAVQNQSSLLNIIGGPGSGGTQLSAQLPAWEIWGMRPAMAPAMATPANRIPKIAPFLDQNSIKNNSNFLQKSTHVHPIQVFRKHWQYWKPIIGGIISPSWNWIVWGIFDPKSTKSWILADRRTQVHHYQNISEYWLMIFLLYETMFGGIVAVCSQQSPEKLDKCLLNLLQTSCKSIVLQFLIHTQKMLSLLGTVENVATSFIYHCDCDYSVWVTPLFTHWTVGTAQPYHKYCVHTTNTWECIRIRSIFYICLHHALMKLNIMVFLQTLKHITHMIHKTAQWNHIPHWTVIENLQEIPRV